MSIQHAAKKITMEFRLARRKNSAKLKSKQDKTTVSYMAGAFGTSVLPEVNIKKSFKIKIGSRKLV